MIDGLARVLRTERDNSRVVILALDVNRSSDDQKVQTILLELTQHEYCVVATYPSRWQISMASQGI